MNCLKIEIIFIGSLELPLILTSLTFFSLLGSAILFDNNSGIVNCESVHLSGNYAHNSRNLRFIN